jgi:hypothetical protein
MVLALCIIIAFLGHPWVGLIAAAVFLYTRRR